MCATPELRPQDNLQPFIGSLGALSGHHVNKLGLVSMRDMGLSHRHHCLLTFRYVSETILDR